MHFRRSLAAFLALQGLMVLHAQEPGVAPPDPAKIASLISDLDAEDWTVRERAQAALDGIGRPALPALEAALQIGPEGERRRRLRELLTDLGVFVWDAASRREVMKRIEALVPAAVSGDAGDAAPAAEEAVAVLASCGHEALPLILDACDTDPRERRRRAGEAARRIASDVPLSLNALIHATRDTRWRVRYYAVVAIGGSRIESAASSVQGPSTSEGDGTESVAPPVIEPVPPGPSSLGLQLQRLENKATAALSELSGDPQDGVRWAAARSLLQRGGEGAGAALTRFLRDRAGEVREMAARGLARHGAEADAPALIALLNGDADPGVRTAAAWALGQIGDPGAEPALIKAVGDREAGVRAHAAGSLGRLKGVTGSACHEALLTALADGAEEVVIAAGESLAIRGDASCTGELVRLLKHGLGRTRDRAARCIAKFGSGAAAEPLVGALADSDSRIRVLAASGLGRIGDPSAVAPLETLLAGEREPDVKRAAAAALGRIGSAAAVLPLLSLLGDSDASVRRHAASALGSCPAAREKETVQALTGLLSSASPEAKEAAALALGKLGQPVSRDPLLALLKREDAEVESRAAAAWWLGRLGDSAVVPDLTRVMVDDALDIRLRVHAASSLAALKAPKVTADVEKLACSSPPSHRGTLAAVLLALGSSAGVPLLIADCASPDPGTRSGADRSLRDLCGVGLPPFDPSLDPAMTRDARRALLRWWRLHRAELEKKTPETGK
ncbi:MAG: HEAT repeat domain-containing protein [Planctomycetes bacterium]|nr:HEAT repeat domain-containing protein [Planctomycetota bacterium]